MWMDAETTVAPSEDAIPLADAKAFLRVTSTAEDTTIGDMVASAVGDIESKTGLRIQSQTCVLRCSSFEDLDHFVTGPVASITSIAYLDASGEEQTLDPATYELFGAKLDRGVRPASGQRWPSVRGVSDAVRVTASVGYATLPAALKRAILLLTADWYENRADTVADRSVTPQTMPNGVASIIVNFTL
jgi:uncharacterized phiE125 gp8 family phage protein